MTLPFHDLADRYLSSSLHVRAKWNALTLNKILPSRNAFGYSGNRHNTQRDSGFMSRRVPEWWVDGLPWYALVHWRKTPRIRTKVCQKCDKSSQKVSEATRVQVNHKRNKREMLHDTGYNVRFLTQHFHFMAMHTDTWSSIYQLLCSPWDQCQHLPEKYACKGWFKIAYRFFPRLEKTIADGYSCVIIHNDGSLYIHFVCGYRVACSEGRPSSQYRQKLWENQVTFLSVSVIASPFGSLHCINDDQNAQSRCSIPQNTSHRPTCGCRAHAKHLSTYFVCNFFSFFLLLRQHRQYKERIQRTTAANRRHVNMFMKCCTARKAESRKNGKLFWITLHSHTFAAIRSHIEVKYLCAWPWTGGIKWLY